MLAFEERSTRRIASRSKGENQQQTQPTLVERECYQHCAILAPPCNEILKRDKIERTKRNAFALTKVLCTLLCPWKWSLLFETSHSWIYWRVASYVRIASSTNHWKGGKGILSYKSVYWTLQSWVNYDENDSTSIEYSDLENWFKGKILSIKMFLQYSFSFNQLISYKHKIEKLRVTQKPCIIL